MLHPSLTACLVACIIALCSSQEPSCGVRPSSEQIVGGVEAPPNSWPWQLSLQFRGEESSAFRHTCGATLYNKGWALTAAHCVDPNADEKRGIPSNFRLLAGAHDIYAMSGNEQVLNITKIIRHERFDADPSLGFPNDIAILKLGTVPDTSRKNIDYACVPYPSTLNFTGLDCYMTGWGLTEGGDTPPAKLQQGVVPVLENSECAKEFPYIRDTHICVGRGRPSACSGDSGGPLNCYRDGKWYVSGITSFGIVFCEGWPSVYTRVSKYWDWMAENMDKN